MIRLVFPKLLTAEQAVPAAASAISRKRVRADTHLAAASLPGEAAGEALAGRRAIADPAV
jgi:hypothetical protein